MWKNIWWLSALCILAVKAQKKDVENPNTSTKTDPETKIVEPANISALYIGDLLRTKPKEELEPSDSIHRPVVSERGFMLPSPIAGRVVNFKAHGGHEYVQTEFIKPLLQSRSHMSSALDRNAPTLARNAPTLARNAPTLARNAPTNIMGHLLTLKPVKLVPAHALPTGRNSGSHYESPHHSKEDCSKNGDHSYSSEDKSYVPEQRGYRRAKQIAPNSDPEYRSPPSSYSEDDRPGRYYSHSSPSSYDTKSNPTDTRSKSHSSGSYSKSTSKSTSKTENQGRPKQRRIVPETYHGAVGGRKNLGKAHGDRGVIVYKTKESPNSHKTSSHTENTEKDYSPEYDERDHRSGHRDEYSQHPSEIRRPRQPSYDGHSTYPTTEQQPPNERYTPYKQAPYQHAEDSYEQKPYDAPVEHHYRKQNNPNSNPHYEPGYTAQPDIREQQKPYSPNYQTPESPVPYSSEQPRKTHSKKRNPSSPYEKPPVDDRENTEYRSRDYSAPEYNYPPEHQIQSSRPKDVRPRSNYETFSPSGSPTGPAPTSHIPYDNDNLALRPSEEKPMNSYVYEATPHQATIKHSERPINRPYRESSRSARSPARHLPPVIVEGRANLPREGTEHVALVTKESQPQISHSVSYSESSYNMGENKKPKAQENLKEKEQAKQTEGRQASTDYQTSYKPYNSEYPASYANDQRDQYKPQTYGEPHGQPHSYEETPQQYQPHNEEQSYEHDGSQDQDHGYDQKEAPVRKGGKNHHYISKIEGFKDTYGPDEHLELDDEFFRKYGISKTAKVIVANAKDTNLFVADGTKVKEGEHFESSGPPAGGNYEPNYQSNYKEDISHETPEGLGLRDIPGSFDELVDTNPSFLGHLSDSMKPSDGYFKSDGQGDLFDDIEFRNAGEQKGYVVSKNTREIVQQHGDGVSRILFNVPKGDSKAQSSNLHKVQHKGQKDEKHSESKVIETSVKSKS